MKRIITTILIMATFQISSMAQAPPPYPSAPPAPGNISNIEYFIDGKPEFGSAAPLTGFTASPNITGFNGTVNLTGLPTGFHRIYFRSKDANGAWSQSNNSFFDNYNVPVYASAPPSPVNITNIEYFIDSKPEFGSGTALTGFTASPDINAYTGTVNLTGVPAGFHRIYFRSKDANNKWGQTINSFFDNYNVPVYFPAPPPVVNVVQLEYFIDNNDLGFGNCTQIPITPGTNIAGLNANINITGLPQGVHRLFIRSKDANNKWGLTNFSVFDNSATQPYPGGPPAPPPISDLEYYIDSDPGFGNATPVTVPGNTGNISNYSVNLALSGSLSVGTHYLYIRSRQNPWSLTNVVPFTATSVVPVSWLYIKAQLQNNNGIISWGTASESNTDRFEIEHSTDGSIFTKIGLSPAAGNSNIAQHYTFTHNNLPNGFSYYRIKQIDKDGKFKYSAIVTLLNRNGLRNTIMAPNPVSNVLHIIEPSLTFVQKAEVYSCNGALVLSKAVNNDVQVFSLQVGNLPAGMYTVTVTYKNEAKTYSFIKQ